MCSSDLPEAAATLTPSCLRKEQTPSGDLHAEAGAKSKAEPQELCEQRRERELSPSSLRSSRVYLHSQLDVPCICGIPEQMTNHAKIEVVDVGSNCRFGVCFLHLICSCLYVYLSLVFRVDYH